MIPSKDITAALTVSFLTIAAGAAFGIWTGVGATLGIFSMAIASVIGFVFGGLPVKTSGPTGPTAGLMFASTLALTAGGHKPELIIIVLFLSALILFWLSFFRISKLLDKVPYVSIAIFVNGVSLFIIYKQFVKIYGYSELNTSSQIWETSIALGVVGLLYLWPRIAKLIKPIPFSNIVSGSLFVMFVGAVVTQIFSPDVNTLKVDKIDFSTLFPDFTNIVDFSAFPYATVAFLTLKMSFILTLVTVITARALSNKDNYSRELRNQSLANVAVAAIGGVPVTIGFIRTKLLEKTGATTAWAGVLLGVMVVTIVIFFDFILQMVPTAVFVGILIKAGLSSLDLQAWRDYQEDSSKWITFVFVTVGSILIIWFDIVIVFMGSIALWALLRRFTFSKKHCKDISDCPCMG